MKKLLLVLFAFTTSTLFAQFDTTQIAIVQILQPTDTFWVDMNGDGDTLNTIEILLRNNDTIDFVGDGTPLGSPQMSFIFTVNGNPPADPDNNGWTRQLTTALNQGSDLNFILTQSYAPYTILDGETAEVCVQLNMIIITATGSMYINDDPNKQFCKTFEFASKPSDTGMGIGDVDAVSFEKVFAANGLLRVLGNTTANKVNIEVINLGGQLIMNRTVAGNGNFSTEFDVSNLQTGVYIVTMSTGNGPVMATKIVISN